MEESEQRRERLRAMRMEASQAEVGSNVETFAVPNSLSNPLVENSAAQPMQEQPFASSRFGFYTDPMAAFSANKRRGQPDNQIRQEPRNSGMTPTPAYQLRGSSSFDQRMYQAQGPYSNPATYGGPRGASPLPMHQGTPEAWNGLQATTGHYSSTTYGHRSPRGMVIPFPTVHQGTPESWNRPGGTGYNSPSHASGGSQYFSPGFGPVRSPGFGYGQGWPHWQGRSPSPGSGRGQSSGSSPGRGRGRWYGGSMSSGLGRSGGRGRGLHSYGLGAGGRQGSECFYDKSMDENPWQKLEPLIWKSRSLKNPSSSNSWLPKSISVKKPRVSEASGQSSSQPSLAEYLAASLSEVANDAANS